MNEKNLRRLVKKVFKDNVEWVEQARGSTVGMPDCILNFDGHTIPVELKYWKRTRKGLKTVMRPAQIRYHKMAVKKNVRTAILFAEDIYGSVNEFWLYLIPGCLTSIGHPSLPTRLLKPLTSSACISLS